ncbi:MAG: sulfurtransferase TusA family protein [Candidatus Nanopelagicales bacterium]|nr:sulfurtransferase TusA family protein [Candidatus Nanopelagicales bacterium]
MTADATPDRVLDERGFVCPHPVTSLARVARELGSGLVELLADDPTAQLDIPAWCWTQGAELLSQTTTDGVTRFLIRVSDPGAGPGSNQE